MLEGAGPLADGDAQSAPATTSALEGRVVGLGHLCVHLSVHVMVFYLLVSFLLANSFTPGGFSQFPGRQAISWTRIIFSDNTGSPRSPDEPLVIFGQRLIFVSQRRAYYVFGKDLRHGSVKKRPSEMKDSLCPIIFSVAETHHGSDFAWAAISGLLGRQTFDLVPRLPSLILYLGSRYRFSQTSIGDHKLGGR